MHGKHGLIKMDQVQELMIVGILLLIGVLLGGSGLWYKVKGAINALTLLMVSLSKAAEDDNFDREEIRELIRLAQAFIASILSLKNILFKQKRIKS